MMKTTLLILWSILVVSPCEGQTRTTLSGRLDSFGSDSVMVIEYSANYERLKADSFLLRNGQFSYTVDADKLRHVRIFKKPAAGARPDFFHYYDIMVLPGKDVKINGSTDNYSLEGDKFYEQTNAVNAFLLPIAKEQRNVVNRANDRLARGEERKIVFEDKNKALAALSLKRDSLAMRYMRLHPDHDINGYLYTLVGAKSRPLVTELVRRGALAECVQWYDNLLQKEEDRKIAEKKIQPGAPAPDFTLNDIHGKPFALSSLRGKYVVLDFWGSWCHWCIKGMPQMKEYYAKYGDRLEVVGIDCEDTDTKWKAAVKAHGLPWVHVYAPKDSPVVTQYAVKGFPTKIVIDPEGTILKVVEGENNTFYKFLDGLFSTH